MLIENKQIAIVGGGPGGLTLARLLQLKGANVKVYERDVHQDAREQGTTLDLHEESGLAALQKAGLMDAFKSNYRPGAEKMRIMDNQGTLFYDEHAEEKEETFGGKHFRPEIDRGPLRKLLLDSLAPGTVVWDRQFVSMKKQGDGRQLQFKNKTTAYADIVVGADGANSTIRPYLTPIKAFYSGVSGIEGNIYQAATTVPDIDQLLKGGKIFAFGGGKDVILSSKGDGSISFYASYRTDEHSIKNSGIDFSDKMQVIAWFKKEFPEWRGFWLELFEKASIPFIFRPIYCIPLDQSWETLPDLTLLGDAAHLMPPFAGEGVNVAMLDALELSESLTGTEIADTASAINHYEIRMRKRAAEAAQMSLENTDWMHSGNALEKMLAMFNGPWG